MAPACCAVKQSSCCSRIATARCSDWRGLSLCRVTRVQRGRGEGRGWPAAGSPGSHGHQPAAEASAWRVHPRARTLPTSSPTPQPLSSATGSCRLFVQGLKIHSGTGKKSLPLRSEEPVQGWDATWLPPRLPRPGSSVLLPSLTAEHDGQLK